MTLGLRSDGRPSVRSRRSTERYPYEGSCEGRYGRALIDPLPLRPLALMLMGALGEACFYVADADDREVAREEAARDDPSASLRPCGKASTQ